MSFIILMMCSFLSVLEAAAYFHLNVLVYLCQNCLQLILLSFLSTAILGEETQWS